LPQPGRPLPPAMLALNIAVASAFQPAATLPLLAPTPLRAAPIAMMYNYDEDEEFIDIEKEESIKTCAFAAISGTVASAPVKASALLASNAFAKATTVGQWEFSTCVLAVQLALFGLVYRAAVRSDDNDNQKQGCIGAFALFRALSATQVSATWNPSSFFDPHMWLTLGVYMGESAIAFGCAAAAIEMAWNRGWSRPLPGVGLPVTRNYYNDYGEYEAQQFGPRRPGPGFRGSVRPTRLGRGREPYFNDGRPYADDSIAGATRRPPVIR